MSRKPRSKKTKVPMFYGSKFLLGLEFMMDAMDSIAEESSQLRASNEVKKFKRTVKNGRKSLMTLQKQVERKARVSATNKRYYKKVKKRAKRKSDDPETFTDRITKAFNFS